MDFETRQELIHDLRALLEPSIEREGFDLVAIEITNEHGSRILRLSIDMTDGVNIDHCAKVSVLVSAQLDVEDPIPGAYKLEVSSPGVERPLQRTEDFTRFSGQRAKVRLAKGEGRRRYTGTLQGLKGTDLCIEVDGRVERLPLDRIDKARLAPLEHPRPNESNREHLTTRGLS